MENDDEDGSDTRVVARAQRDTGRKSYASWYLATQILSLSLSPLIDCSSTRVHAYRAHIKSLLTVINRPAAGPGIYLTLRTPRGSFLAPRVYAYTGIRERELVGM